MNPLKILGNPDCVDVSSVASDFVSFGGMPVNISEIEAEWRLLRHTPTEVMTSTPLLEFWAAVASYKSAGGRDE